jgi:hypothetical protein
MRGLFMHGHHWCVMAERAAARIMLVLTGLVLMVVGLALGISMVLLPIGVSFAVGAGMFVWGAVGEMPIEE